MIFLNIGSNLDSINGNRIFNLKKTLELIKLEKINIIRLSSIYETPSYPNKKNPKFINIGVEIKCNFSPTNLIKKFHKIEKKLQRTRGVKNQPRTCDIDLIDYKGKVLLYPMKDISPNWIHPTLNKRVDFLIKKLGFKLRNEITRIKEHATIIA